MYGSVSNCLLLSQTIFSEPLKSFRAWLWAVNVIDNRHLCNRLYHFLLLFWWIRWKDKTALNLHCRYIPVFYRRAKDRSSLSGLRQHPLQHQDQRQRANLTSYPCQSQRGFSDFPATALRLYELWHHLLYPTRLGVAWHSDDTSSSIYKKRRNEKNGKNDQTY